MGSFLSAIVEDFYNQFRKQTSFLVLGLDNAGKTQILYCMKLGECITNTVPTLGFNLEEFKYKNLSIKAWDLGGQCKFRSMWHHYFEGVQGIVFVVDSQDRRRFTDSKNELHRLLENEHLAEVPFLVFANKQDLPEAAEIEEMKKKFEWDKICHKHTIHMIGCCAAQNHRITLGLDWLANTIV